MKIKHLQLNTSTLKSPTEVAKFIKNNNIDIACLQEIVYPSDTKSPLKELVEASNYNYLEGINFIYAAKNQIVAEAIVPKWPITDYYLNYYNSPNYSPKVIKSEDILEGDLVIDTAAMNMPGSRGIKHLVKSRCIITSLIQTPAGTIRVMTTHFPVSDFCTEIMPMFEMAKLVASLVRHSKPMPTIFSGDLNIRSHSYSVMKLQEVMECHTRDLKDTLSISHESKKKDFPNGLAIDHVFSKDMNHLSTEAIEVDFSGHKAVVSEFEMG